ncbi:MAG: signal peptidase I [Oligoflexales bacterium]|nr:signal peptidase I [Oligoflexales bacterium]
MATEEHTLDVTKTRKQLNIQEKNEDPGFFSFENLSSLFVLVIVVLAIRWTIASPYYVPTASMEPTIKVGDRLLAFKLAYNFKIPFLSTSIFEWGSPEKGDIIVFRYPRDPSIDYVKRVVGVAGDRIKIVDDVLYVNGVAQDRMDYNHDREVLEDIEDHKELKLLFKEQLAEKTHWTMNMIPSSRHFSQSNWPIDGSFYTVPEGAVFVFGDNRDNSADSRIWGKVPIENIHGKALFVLWSAYTPKDSHWTLRFSRFGHWLDGDVPNS